MATTAAAPAAQRIGAQTRIELALTLRRGESVLLTFAIPVIVLGFFSLVDVLPTGTDDPVDFLLPGVVALAVMSTAMVSLAISTGFERSQGVLKRLAVTPLARRDLLAAKILAVLVIEALQVGLLLGEGLLLGWEPTGDALALVAGCVIASVGFAGLGMLMAGSLPALTTLALANGLYLVLALFSGMLVPLGELPDGVRRVAELLPSGALSDLTQAALGTGGVPGRAWVVLVAWAVVAPAVAAWRFRWE